MLKHQLRALTAQNTAAPARELPVRLATSTKPADARIRSLRALPAPVPQLAVRHDQPRPQLPSVPIEIRDGHIFMAPAA